MELTSPVFENEGRIPPRHTCDGENTNPPLSISAVPPGAKSLVLIMDDPDVPQDIRADGMWDQWVVFNIPPTHTEIKEGQEPQGRHGLGTGNNMEYFGPCPPDGEHRYFFKLYALDKALPDKEFVQSAQQLEQIGESTLCILCAACSASCPSSWPNQDYLGPAALLKAYRFIFDSRDDGQDGRIEIVNDKNGIWRCHTIFNCVEACPKKIKITEYLSRLKLKVVENSL